MTSYDRGVNVLLLFGSFVPASLASVSEEDDVMTSRVMSWLILLGRSDLEGLRTEIFKIRKIKVERVENIFER